MVCYERVKVHEVEREIVSYISCQPKRFFCLGVELD